MWQTYSVLSKNKKPQISREEFMNYYHIEEAEVQKCELQNFLDFFEVSKDDLHMKSKEEVFLALQGFRLDREAEQTISEEQNLLVVEDIKEVEFRGVSGGKRICGRIDFVNGRLEFDGQSRPLLHSDNSVLVQALRDVGLTTNISAEQELGKNEIWEFEIRCENDMKRLVRAPIVHPKVFLQIIEMIMLRRD